MFKTMFLIKNNKLKQLNDIIIQKGPINNFHSGNAIILY